MRKLRAAGVALTALMASGTAWSATVAPEPGRYLADILVSEVHGVECPDRLGAEYHGVVDYRGLDGHRLIIRIPVVFDGYSVIDRQVLTVTSGAGTLKPRGDFFAHISAPIDLGVRGSFEAELTLSDDREAFRARVTEMAPLIDCTEVFRIALVRAG
jgi:hypothetical protein